MNLRLGVLLSDMGTLRLHIVFDGLELKEYTIVHLKKGKNLNSTLRMSTFVQYEHTFILVLNSTTGRGYNLQH